MKTARCFRASTALSAVVGLMVCCLPAGVDDSGGPIPHAGWWTLALAFDERGVGHYYARPGVGPLAAEHRIWDTTRFRPGSGENPKMDSVAYGFFSLGYPADGRLTPSFIVDDYEVWIAGDGAAK